MFAQSFAFALCMGGWMDGAMGHNSPKKKLICTDSVGMPPLHQPRATDIHTTAHHSFNEEDGDGWGTQPNGCCSVHRSFPSSGLGRHRFDAYDACIMSGPCLLHPSYKAFVTRVPCVRGPLWGTLGLASSVGDYP
eukprot:scaffold3795_cov126-Isochrysis_galbana.AAC.22